MTLCVCFIRGVLNPLIPQSADLTFTNHTFVFKYKICFMSFHGYHPSCLPCSATAVGFSRSWVTKSLTSRTSITHVSSYCRHIHFSINTSGSGVRRVSLQQEFAGHGSFKCSLPLDRKSTRLNSSHRSLSRMPSSA